MGNRTGRIAVFSACLTAGALCLAGAAHAASLVVSSASGDPGSQVTFTVSLTTAGASVAGTQNDVAFDPANIPVAPKASGKCSVTKTKTCSADGDCPSGEVCVKAPDCSVNPDIDKGATSFAFRPNNCSGAACTSIRALVLSTSNVDPIPDKSVLYTCKVAVAGTAQSGTYPLTVSGVILSDPDGGQVPNASGCNGSVIVGGGGVTPTITPTQGGEATNTPTLTPTPTNTLPPPTTTATKTVGVPTSTATAVKTNTPTPVKTATGGPAPFDDDGGCNISTSGSSNAGWLVLIPAIGLLAMRRRRR